MVRPQISASLPLGLGFPRGLDGFDVWWLRTRIAPKVKYISLDFLNHLSSPDIGRQ